MYILYLLKLGLLFAVDNDDAEKNLVNILYKPNYARGKNQEQNKKFVFSGIFNLDCVQIQKHVIYVY